MGVLYLGSMLLPRLQNFCEGLVTSVEHNKNPKIKSWGFMFLPGLSHCLPGSVNVWFFGIYRENRPHFGDNPRQFLLRQPNVFHYHCHYYFLVQVGSDFGAACGFLPNQGPRRALRRYCPQFFRWNDLADKPGRFRQIQSLGRTSQ